MKIAVCIKQTPDTEARIRIGPEGIDEAGLTWIISPHDESAVEQALQLKERQGGHVTAIALGPGRVESAIREALAMGADSGLHLACDVMPHDAVVIARALAEAISPRAFDLVLTGEQSIDQAGSQVPQRLAVALRWPCVTAVESLQVVDGIVRARRPVEQEEEAVQFAVPGVVGINRRIGEPRYPSFRGIMQARRKTIEVVRVQLGAGPEMVQRLQIPAPKAAGQVQEFGSGIEREVANLLAGKAAA